MAKLKMKKIELIAPLTESKKIIELLQRRGVVELCRNTDEELEQTNVNAVNGEFGKFRSTVLQALDILDTYAPEKQGINEMFGGRTEVDKHDFGSKAMELEKIMNTANDIIRCRKTIADSQAEKAQLEVRADTLRPWRELDVPMNFKGTSTTAAFIGSLPFAVEPDELEEQLPEGTSAEVVSASKEQTDLFILCSDTVRDEAEEQLRKMGFIPISESDSRTPQEAIQDCADKMNELEERVELRKKLSAHTRRNASR